MPIRRRTLRDVTLIHRAVILLRTALADIDRVMAALGRGVSAGVLLEDRAGAFLAALLSHFARLSPTERQPSLSARVALSVTLDRPDASASVIADHQHVLVDRVRLDGA